jgi:hypothetical protein
MIALKKVKKGRGQRTGGVRTTTITRRRKCSESVKP